MQVSEKSKVIFGNEMSGKVVKQAEDTKAKFIKKFGDDQDVTYRFASVANPVLAPLQTKVLVDADDEKHQKKAKTNPRWFALEEPAFTDKSILIGNIRMGFGHYRISMAMASCAAAMGYDPLWLDLNSFDRSTCTKIISSQNDLYSLGSRLSGKSKLFNKLYWEPLNSEGFRKLSYNACDQASAELMANLLKPLPKDVPMVATHVWPAQAAVHAGFTQVVNAIPDNWPMALHLSEGSIHTVQTESAFLGYKALRGMDQKRSLKPMPEGSLYYTGHYVDHELVSNLEHDTAQRLERVQSGKAKRFLLTVGGAGAQQEIFVQVIRTLLPRIEKGEAALFLNVGDHKKVWDGLKKKVPELKAAKLFMNQYQAAAAFAADAVDGAVSGIYAFCHKDIFSAVYITNLLMRASDVLVTKPSELSFYPVPKLFIHRVGGHEAYGALRGAEMGDGTYECETARETADMIRLMLDDPEVLIKMNEKILKNKEAGLYDGAYRVVELAMKR